jgi:flagellar motor switch protein FliG
MFVFEDIVMLDNRSIQKVIREVDTQDLTRALKGVDTEVQEKVFQNVSKRAAQALKEDMEYMGPVRIKDVEEAQQKIVAVIRHLEDTGEIIIARGEDDQLIQ